MGITYEKDSTDPTVPFKQEELVSNVVNPLTGTSSFSQYASQIQNNPYEDILQNNQGILNLLNGDMQSPNFATGVVGWRIRSDGSVEFGSGYFRGDITGATGTFSGTVSVGSLNIPDSTTANSFHVDSNGNTWWGANVASGYAGANAYVLNTGSAFFNNIKVGGTTYQYTITDNGVFSFGDGSDGTATFDGIATPTGSTKSGSDYTLTRDVYYTNVTLSTGTTLNPAGYRIFATGTLTLNGTAVIKRNGNAGGAGSNSGTGVGGTGGAALADGYLKGSVAGQAGASGISTAGTAGTNTSNSIGSNGSSGSGGTGGGAGGAGGTATVSNVKLIANWHLATLLDISSSGSTIKFDNSAGAGSGGSSLQNGGVTGGGGGSGSSGGIIAIYSRNIVIGASASITAIGGAGGAGGSGNAFGGGGGGGGNGGQIILVYNTITNSGALTVTGGAGGSHGSGGTNGTAGTAGTTRLFQISL